MVADDSLGGVSVCIPVHNEAVTIGNVLASLRTIPQLCIQEILVCANGSTDDSAAVVRRCAAADQRIRLIEIPQRGKPRAWNCLVHESISPVLVFLDGDIGLPRQTLPALVAVLQARADLIAVTAMPVPHQAHRRGLNRLLPETMPQEPQGIAGCCYAFRKAQLLEHLLVSGFSSMPEDIIPEDRWLALVLGGRCFTCVSEAPVIHVLPDIREVVSRMRRHCRGHLQIQRYYPQLMNSLPPLPPLHRRLFRVWKERRSTTAFLHRVVGALVFRLLLLVATVQVRLEPRRSRFSVWDSAGSTKVVVTPQ